MIISHEMIQGEGDQEAQEDGGALDTHVSSVPRANLGKGVAISMVEEIC